MDTRSKVLSYTLSILIVLSVAASFFRFMVLHDYIVTAEVDCDPETESCFVWTCDPEVDCTGNPDEDTWHYKVVERNAQYIPECDPESGSCDLYTCSPEEAGCSVTYCDPEVELCSTPSTSEVVLEETTMTESSEDMEIAAQEADVSMEESE